MSAADDFLQGFFGATNGAWPDMEPTHPAATNLNVFLQALAHPGECPVILPRQRVAALPGEIYVIAWGSAHAGRVRVLLEAAVAHHWVPFDGRLAPLDPGDPIDKAVLDFVGPGTTFVLKAPTDEALRHAIRALRRLVVTLDGRPLRSPTLARPVGRMLREFDVALSAGAVEASASLLNEIESLGGVSHENIAFLRVRRLSRLGSEAELLGDDSLTSLVFAEPPFLVREAVLGAWARLRVLPALASGGVEVALATVRQAVPDVAMLVDERMLRTKDNDVAVACAIASLAREDYALADGFAAGRALPWALPERTTESDLLVPVPLPEVGVDDGDPASWLEWVASLVVYNDTPLVGDVVDTWTPAWSVDVELSSAIDALPQMAEDNLLRGVRVLLETDEPERAAVHTAASLITRYLLSERFDPADLAAQCALLQIFVRGAPPAARYDDVLSNVREYSSQWVSVLNAVRVIDIADAVACGPGLSAERENFVSALLSPLNAQKSRLSASMRGLAKMVSDDLNLAMSWDVADNDGALKAATDSAAEVALRILLYSLDDGTLARTKAAIGIQWPNAIVEASADKVGSPRLRTHSRNANLIVLATRRAAHAATTFIVSNANESAHIGYADGSGSASMFRAVDEAMAGLAI